MTKKEILMAEMLLHTMAYMEMTDEQLELVVEYETMMYQPKVAELKNTLTKDGIAEQIHDWWLNYEIADETEKNLLNYLYN